MSKYKLLFLFLFPILLIISNWVLIFYFYNEFNFDLRILLNFNDIEYFPFIISLSEFDFSPSFNDHFNSNKMMTFPYASIIYHTLFFKLFGMFGYIIAQICFVALSYYTIYYFIKKSGISDFASILTVLSIFFIPTLLELINTYLNSDFLLHFQNQIFDNHLTSYRYPRPLVTNIYFYISLILLIELNNNDIKPKIYLYLSIILSLLLQSFIYLFILISFVLFIKIIKKILINKNYIVDNYPNYLKFLIIFIIFSSPFIIQNIFAEEDYGARMGLHSINSQSKSQLLHETFLHFFNFKYLIYIFFIFAFYFIFKQKFNNKFKNSFEQYLLLVFSSFLIPFIFIIFSPYIIWYKHFFDVKNLVFILGVILILSYFIFQIKLLTKKKEFIILFFFSLIIFFTNLSVNINKLSSKTLNNEYLVELNKVLITSEKIINQKKLNIFSTPGISNYYFTLKNQNILFPYGFHVSLSDKQLETSMINSLKSIGLSKNNFKNFLKNDIDWKSKNNISQITGFKYQFNSFFTFFKASDYTKKELEFLDNNKLFLSESIALSNKKIDEFVDIYSNHKIIKSLMPDLVIIEKSYKNLNFLISTEYSTIIDNEFFSLYLLKSK